MSPRWFVKRARKINVGDSARFRDSEFTGAPLCLRRLRFKTAGYEKPKSLKGLKSSLLRYAFREATTASPFRDLIGL
jgi:hypothetical protein